MVPRGTIYFLGYRGWASDDLAVWAPNAPIPIGMGACWFEFEDITRKDLERPLALQKTTDPTYAALMDYIQKHQYESVILGGFSQGSMLALHIMAMYQPSWPVLAYGGGFFTQNPPSLDGSEVCMIHGASDDVVEPTYLTESMLTLARHGVSVEGHLKPYVGHNIDLVGAPNRQGIYSAAIAEKEVIMTQTNKIPHLALIGAGGIWGYLGPSHYAAPLGACDVI